MNDEDLLIDYDEIKILSYDDLSEEQKKEVDDICKRESITLSEDMPEELYPDTLIDDAESDGTEE